MNKLNCYHIYIIIYIYPIPTPRNTLFLSVFMQKLWVLPTDLPAKALDVFSPSARRAARSVRKMRCHLSQLSQNWFSGVSFSFGDNLVHSFSRIAIPPERATRWTTWQRLFCKPCLSLYQRKKEKSLTKLKNQILQIKISSGAFHSREFVVPL